MTNSLRNLIHKNRKTFLEQATMSCHDLEIQQLIGNLDQVALSVEARWGCDRLPQIVNVPLRDKWQRQFDKLNAAIETNNLALLRDLVPGTIRAYAALEAAAIGEGHQPYDPVFWEVALPDRSTVVRIVKNDVDASIAKQAGFRYGRSRRLPVSWWRTACARCRMQRNRDPD